MFDNGEALAREVANLTNRQARIKEGRDDEADLLRPGAGLGNQAEDGQTGVTAAVSLLDRAIAEQSELLNTLWRRLEEAGVLRPTPANAAGAQAARPKRVMLSERIRERAQSIGGHNYGLMEIIKRLDV